MKARISYGFRLRNFCTMNTHNTRAHYSVHTTTQKLIYFWKKNQWEMYDLVADPGELHNLYAAPAHFNDGLHLVVRQGLPKAPRNLLVKQQAHQRISAPLRPRVRK